MNPFSVSEPNGLDRIVVRHECAQQRTCDAARSMDLWKKAGEGEALLPARAGRTFPLMRPWYVVTAMTDPELAELFAYGEPGSVLAT